MCIGEQMCSLGRGRRRLRDDCVYLYKNSPLKKWSPQGLRQEDCSQTPGLLKAPEDCQLYKKSPQAFSFSYRRDSQVHL